MLRRSCSAAACVLASRLLVVLARYVVRRRAQPRRVRVVPVRRHRKASVG